MSHREKKKKKIMKKKKKEIRIVISYLMNKSKIRQKYGYLCEPSVNVFSMLQARPLFKERKKFPQMADPMLQGQYPVRGLYQALAVAAMCVQEQPTMRPLIADVVTALTYLASQKYDPESQPVQAFRMGSSTPRTRREQ